MPEAGSWCTLDLLTVAVLTKGFQETPEGKASPQLATVKA
jgi:hypothetical protein